jgi:Zinc-binding dehydrogenase
MVTQLAREAGAYVIGSGRAADRQKALDFGAQEFVDLDNDALEDVGKVDLVFDVIGGDIHKRSAGLVRVGGTLVTVIGPAEARPSDGLAIFFVVESDRPQLSEIVQRVRDGRLRTNIGNVSTLDNAVGRRCPDRPAESNQTRRGQPGKLPCLARTPPANGAQTTILARVPEGTTRPTFLRCFASCNMRTLAFRFLIPMGPLWVRTKWHKPLDFAVWRFFPLIPDDSMVGAQGLEPWTR